jgi:hypothetical protein
VAPNNKELSLSFFSWRRVVHSCLTPAVRARRSLDQVESPGRRWSLFFSVTGLARFARLAALCRAPDHLHVLAAQSGAVNKALETTGGCARPGAPLRRSVFNVGVHQLLGLRPAQVHTR